MAFSQFSGPCFLVQTRSKFQVKIAQRTSTEATNATNAANAINLVQASVVYPIFTVFVDHSQERLMLLVTAGMMFTQTVTAQCEHMKVPNAK